MSKFTAVDEEKFHSKAVCGLRDSMTIVQNVFARERCALLTCD